MLKEIDHENGAQQAGLETISAHKEGGVLFADIAAPLSADSPHWKTGSRSGHLSRRRQWRLRLLTLRFRSRSTSGASAGAQPSLATCAGTWK